MVCPNSIALGHKDWDTLIRPGKLEYLFRCDDDMRFAANENNPLHYTTGYTYGFGSSLVCAGC